MMGFKSGLKEQSHLPVRSNHINGFCTIFLKEFVQLFIALYPLQLRQLGKPSRLEIEVPMYYKNNQLLVNDC